MYKPWRGYDLQRHRPHWKNRGLIENPSEALGAELELLVPEDEELERPKGASQSAVRAWGKLPCGQPKKSGNGRGD